MSNIIFLILIISHLLLALSLIGLYASWNNFLLMLLSIELSILSIIIMFLLFSILLDNIINQIFSLFILTSATIETAIGISLLLNFINLKTDIQITNLE